MLFYELTIWGTAVLVLGGIGYGLLRATRPKEGETGRNRLAELVVVLVLLLGFIIGISLLV